MVTYCAFVATLLLNQGFGTNYWTQAVKFVLNALQAKTHEKVDSLGENRSIACHTVCTLLRS